MFWFERKAEEIKVPKTFIMDVLHLFTTSLAGEGGVQLGRYIVDIENPEIKQRFLVAVDELMSEVTEDWIKEELEITQKVLKTWKKVPDMVRSAASAG
jgi:hypothetical protein